MSDSLDGNHRIHSRSTWKTGTIHHEKIAHFPRFAIGLGRGSFGRAAKPGRPHDVEGKKRKSSRIPARGIHSLGERFDRAIAAWLVSAPFCVRRKNMAGGPRLHEGGPGGRKPAGGGPARTP